MYVDFPLPVVAEDAKVAGAQGSASGCWSTARATTAEPGGEADHPSPATEVAPGRMGFACTLYPDCAGMPSAADVDLPPGGRYAPDP